MTDTQLSDIRREIGILGYAFLWVLGRPLVELQIRQTSGQFTFVRQPAYLWKCEICDRTWVQVRYAPNAFHRAMQRIAFGVRWHCLV